MDSYEKKIKNKELEFTGERLIPKLNEGTTFYYEHLARYLFASQLVKNKVVLDAGCGSGYGSFILAKYGKAKKVYAIDISQESIDYAQNKYFHKDVEYKKDSVFELKTILDNSIDISICFEVIEHINDQGQFLTQIKRVLKKNGVFIVSTPNKYTYPEGNIFHKKELYPKEFLQLLKKYFKNVTFFHQSFELTQIVKPEGLKSTFILDQKLSMSEVKTFMNPVDPSKSQYITALCSDFKLESPKLLAITAQKVDNFDLTLGTFSLGKQFQDLYRNLEIQSNKINKKNTLIKKLENNVYESTQQLRKEKALHDEQLRKEKALHDEQLNKKNIIIQSLDLTLDNIKSSKVFRLWQAYCRIRDKILKKNYGSKITKKRKK